MTARRATVSTAITLAALLAAVGCASTSRAASDRAGQAIDSVTTTSIPSAGPTTTSTTLPNPCLKDDPVRSYRPIDLPPPGVPPSGEWADRIRNQNKLRVGVDENTYYFSFKDPVTGEITGFEAELGARSHAVIFPGVDNIDTKIKFVTVTTNQKFDVVHNGTVDLTIDVATIGCSRWGVVDFSTPYYEAHQQLMVRNDSPVEGQDDLAGKRVCVTTPSSSETFVSGNIPTAKIVRANTRTECLTRLQENTVDAIVLPSSIQAGLLVQDPNMKLVGELHGTPSAPAENVYGIAVNKANRDLTRFVNALLEQWRRDDTIEQLQRKSNLPSELQQTPPEARYLD